MSIVSRGLGAPRSGSLVAFGLSTFGVSSGPVSIAGRLCVSLSAASVVLTMGSC